VSFVILRTAKLKTAGEIGGSLGHTFRIMDTPNADQSKIHLNEHEYSLEEIKQNIENRLPDKIRKNGVRVIEYLITMSPDWEGLGTEAEAEFFNQAKRWLNEKHGSENVVGLSIHRDETTPHLVAYVVPIDPENKLNARHFLGGRQKLSEMQTDFANKVSHIGLERGLEGSRAKHTKVKHHYAEIQKPIEKFKSIEMTRLETKPESGFFESKNEYSERLTDAIYNDVSGQFEKYEKQKRAEFSALTAQLFNEKNKNKKLEKQVSELVEVSNKLKNIISEYEQEFEPFQDLKSVSEDKYENLKTVAMAETDAYFKKEIDRLNLVITPKTDAEKQLESSFKNIKSEGPAVDLGAQKEKKQEKNNDFDLGT